jgi:alpha-aminoadipic semialdehyde synthase
MHSFKIIGLLDTDHPIQLRRWSDLPREALRTQLGVPIPDDAASFASALRSLIPESESAEMLDALAWFGLIPTDAQAHALQLPLPLQPTAAIDLFATVLAHQLRYQPGERDLVLLHHELVARPAGTTGTADGEEEVHTASLVAYGDNRGSAMARTVGLPLAFAARAVLDGTVRARGVQGPGIEEAVWRRVLAGLQEAGLGMKESVTRRQVPGVGGVVESALAQARIKL